MRGGLRWIAVTAAVAAAGLAGSLADEIHAEVAEKNGIRVSVSGRMSPTELPRRGTVPIAVELAGRIAATQHRELPKLIAISIAINRYGKLDLAGLPLCRLGHIDPSTTQQALAACRSSLIGEGSFSADVRIPDQSPFPSRGKILAFNGRLRGKPTVFAHIYGTEPVPTSYVLPFSIARARGTYGTILEASLPRATGEWGYVTGISLELDRTYSSAGKKRSVLAAGCPAPEGFPGAVFPLARTIFTFDAGLSLTSVLDRSCKAL